LNKGESTLVSGVKPGAGQFIKGDILKKI